MPDSPPVLLQLSHGPVHAVPSADQNGQLDPNEIVVPARIIHILCAGWTDHIPLDTITNCACRLEASSTTCNTDNGLTMGSDGCIVTKASPIDHSKEDRIEISDWYQASHNLVFAIANFLWAFDDPAPGRPNVRKISTIFNHHFFLLQGRTDFKTLFPVYQEYDITVRRKYLHSSSCFNLSVFQHNLYDSIAHIHDQPECTTLWELLSSSSSTSTPYSGRLALASTPQKGYRYQGSFQPRSDGGWSVCLALPNSFFFFF
jgi:hypothetical protein